ncbi:MAG TPA: Sua5/YciO/YrdC/YwlC family protein, partial [Actinomycetota bacterium]|nr:Sua5/YciO/YrdC/YwlC family protein [Actinomycetota bacterium]
MARFFDVHPENPQQRLIDQVVAMIQQDALVAYPTDSGYALGCRLGNVEGMDRIRRLRELDDHHHYTLVCHDFAQLSQ